MKVVEKRKARAYEYVDTYRVEGITNESDIDIINFCDINNFGGYVYRYGIGQAKVEVNID